MNLYKEEKAELIKNGTFNEYRKMKKDAFDNGFEMSDNPDDYGWTELTLDLVRRLEKQTKRKKQSFRHHAWFIAEYYDNCALLTLGFKDAARDSLSFDTIKKRMAECCKICFDDYIGMLEISKNGKIHGHFIVGWNGSVKTRESYRDGHKNLLVVNKNDLTSFWYGCTLEDGQPSRYGIYDLILLSKERTERNKATNYTLKSLNSMESYITKEEGINDDVVIDNELVFKVNTSSVIVARGTPYQTFKKMQNIQDKEIRQYCKAFDGTYYDDHKFDSRSAFRSWAKQNKEQNISMNQEEHRDLIGKDFEIVTIDNFLMMLNAIDKDAKDIDLRKDFVPFVNESMPFAYDGSIPKSDPIINIYGVTSSIKRKEQDYNDDKGNDSLVRQGI